MTAETEMESKDIPAVPVIYLVFNRPEVTRQSFAILRTLRPARLFVVADGPRPHIAGEAEKCRLTREIATAVDWPCQLRTDFSETNLGLKQRIASGITRAFEEVERAIVLEDDCLPDPTFFRFAAEMLEKYREDERIFCVSGDNFQGGRRRTEADYYFSLYPHCWGWATWRRAWRHFDPALAEWPRLRGQGWLRKLLGNRAAAAYWQSIFDGCADGRINSWAFPWTYSCWVNQGLTILPEVNLVRNIGFGQEGTNTTSADHSASALRAGALSFPLRHPSRVVRHRRADAFTQRHHFGAPGPSLLDRIRRRWRRAFPSASRP